jgi:hypothetical protein
MSTAPPSGETHPPPSGSPITEQTLWDYLEYRLPPHRLAEVEQAVRASAELQALLLEINRRRDNGEHTVGGIWKRYHVSCPDRDAWMAYLMQRGDPQWLAYLRFHLEVIGCLRCRANVQDLSSQHRSHT